MLIGEARLLARAWAEEHAPGLAGFQGAFLTGSTIWRAETDELAPTSDVDMMVVVDGPIPPVKLGKVQYRGLLLDVTYLESSEIEAPEIVLSSYYLASSFWRPGIVFDPTGRLAELHRVVARQFSRREWVESRCEHGWSNAARHFGSLSPEIPWQVQVIIWLFGTAASTIVLLVAGLRNPTVRTRYLAARRLLADYGLLDRYEPLLEDLGCAQLKRDDVEHHLPALEAAFDAAAGVVSSPVFFATDISAAARSISIDGSRDLIERGFHREAVFWIVATYARCQDILSRDGSPEQHDEHVRGFNSLLADLGIRSFDDLAQRAARIEAMKARVWATAEAIMAANPEVS